MQVFILLSILALSLTQNPIPAPALNLSHLEGQWNVAWVYNPFWDSEMTFSDCSLWKITVDPKEAGFISYEGSGWGIGFGFTASNSTTSVWDLQLGGNLTWIAYDPGFSWFTGVSTSDTLGRAFVLSKTAKLSNLVLNAQILLVKAEGYAVNATNQHFYNNTHNGSCIESAVF